MASGGYIKLFRKMTDWEYYNNPAIKAVWIHLLLKASTKTYKRGKYTLKRGQVFVTERELMGELGLTRSKVRTSLQKLHQNNQIIATKVWHGKLVTIVNFDDYQDNNSHKITTKSPQTMTNIQQEERRKESEGIEPSLTEEEIEEGWEEN